MAPVTQQSPSPHQQPADAARTSAPAEGASPEDAPADRAAGGSGSSATVSPAADEEDGPGAGGARGSRRRHRRRQLTTLGAGVLVAGLLVAGATVPINKVIEAPGPTWNVLEGSTSSTRSTAGSSGAASGSSSATGASAGASASGSSAILTVTGTRTYAADGALRMTTVSIMGCPGYKVTVFSLIDAWLHSDRKVLDRDAVCPSSMTAEQVDAVNQAEMTSSQDSAVVAALMETGLAKSMVLTIEQVADGQKDSGLKTGDVITSVTPEGGTTTTITTYSQLHDLMETIAPGTRVTVELTRDGKDTSATLTTLAPSSDDQRKGSMLGVALSVRADSDVDATFGLSDVGGPSAGTMLALGIIDEVTPGDLTGGKDIAGTGTISVSGEVGAIGGIQQKMAGAKASGSDYFLAPASNCDEVVGHEPDGLSVYAVSTLHEAVETVKAIADGKTSGLTTCEAVEEESSAAATASAASSMTPTPSPTAAAGEAAVETATATATEH